MNIHEALRILEDHHKWRQGGDEFPMQVPAQITEASEITLRVLRAVTTSIDKDLIVTLSLYHNQFVEKYYRPIDGAFDRADFNTMDSEERKRNQKIASQRNFLKGYVENIEKAIETLTLIYESHNSNPGKLPDKKSGGNLLPTGKNTVDGKLL